MSNIIPVIIPAPKMINVTINRHTPPTPINIGMTMPGPTGPQGTTGPQGPQGIEGPPGPSLIEYVHTQEAPAYVWTIQHNLNKYPNVLIIDSAGTLVEGDVTYEDLNRVNVTFSALMSGTGTLQ